jgi:hypothetical protein
MIIVTINIYHAVKKQYNSSHPFSTSREGQVDLRKLNELENHRSAFFPLFATQRGVGGELKKLKQQL